MTIILFVVVLLIYIQHILSPFETSHQVSAGVLPMSGIQLGCGHILMVQSSCTS